MPSNRTRHSMHVQALVAALDQAIAGLKAARTIAARLEHVSASPRRSGSRRATAASLGEDAFERAFREGTIIEARSAEDMGVSVHEAAEQLGLGEEQVRRLLRSGELVGVPYGGRRGWRISRDSLQQIAGERRRTKKARSSAARPGDSPGTVSRPPTRVSARAGGRREGEDG